MSLEEMLLRILAESRPLLPLMIAAAVITSAVTAVLLFCARGVWVGSPRFRWMGLFLGLSRNDCCRLGCAWLKLLLLLLMLIGFQKLGPLHYILFLVPGLIYALSPRDLLRIPARLGWLALETLGLLSSNLICGYIRDMEPGWLFGVIYGLMAIFTALLGIYLFFTEINDISAGRTLDLGKEWKADAENGNAED